MYVPPISYYWPLSDQLFFHLWNKLKQKILNLTLKTTGLPNLRFRNKLRAKWPTLKKENRKYKRDIIMATIDLICKNGGCHNKSAQVNFLNQRNEPHHEKEHVKISNAVLLQSLIHQSPVERPTLGKPENKRCNVWYSVHKTHILVFFLNVCHSTCVWPTALKLGWIST